MPLGKLLIDHGYHTPGVIGLTALVPQACKTHGGAQFKCFGLLIARHI